MNTYMAEFTGRETGRKIYINTAHIVAVVDDDAGITCIQTSINGLHIAVAESVQQVLERLP